MFYPFPELVMHPLFPHAKPMQRAWVLVRYDLPCRLKNDAVVTTEGTRSPFLHQKNCSGTVDVDQSVKSGGAMQ